MILNPKFNDKIAITYKKRRITYRELIGSALSFADLLANKKIDKIAIFSENIPEWIMAFYAAWHHDITVVPIDFMANAEDVAYILNDCQPEFIFHSKNTRTVLEKALKRSCHQAFTSCFDEQKIKPKEGIWNKPPDEEKTAVIIYTSGTTGSPKGVMLSYTNLKANVLAVTEDVPIFNETSRVLLVLPLQHIFPLAGVMLAPLSTGGMVAITPSLQGADIIETLQTHQITHIIGVPRLYEVIYKGVMAKINASSLSKGLYKMVKAIKSPRIGKIIFKKVHRQFGGHLKTLVSGGAALPVEVGGFYHAIGFEVLEGFGMTESAPMISFTRPGDVIIGCAGEVLPALEVEIRNGEIVAKGKSVMKGYFNRPEETAKVIIDGWLHTGDLGYLDDKNRLYITGRKKEIIPLPNGKNINPNEIEESMIKYAGNAIEEVGVTLYEDVLHAIILPNLHEMSKMGVSDVAAFFSRFLLSDYNPHVTPYKQVSKFTLVKEKLPRTRLSKLQRFKFPEIIEEGEQPTERKEEPQTKEYQSLKKHLSSLIGKEVYADDHLVFDLALDSLSKLELIDYIKRTFGLEIKEDELLNYGSLRKMADFIAGHKEHFDEQKVDWHKTITQTPDIEFAPPWWTLRFLNFKMRVLFRIYFKIKTTGLREYPQGAGIIAPNHSSYLDAFLVASLLKKQVKDTFFYAKRKHVNTPFRRMMARHHNVIIMDLEKNLHRSIQQIAQVLRSGKKLIIFPEGTRSHNGDLTEFKTTFAILSKELQVPVYPVAVSGAFQAWPRHKKWPKWGSLIKINYLPPIIPADMDEKQITEKTRMCINEALNKT